MDKTDDVGYFHYCQESQWKAHKFSLKMCQIFICIFWTKQWRFQELLSAVFVCCEEKVEQEEKG